MIASQLQDLDQIFELFDQAILYQQKNGYNLWPRFERRFIENEINEKRHWKILHENSLVAVFSVLYSDPVIWAERDKEPSVYLHRIAVNPVFKGNKVMEVIKRWALEHARVNHKKYLRMDTWGTNETLKNYYIHCGFNYIGQQYIKNPDGEDMHYGGPVLSLFELAV